VTPEQLRQSSAKHLTDAQDYLAKGDYDRAAYDAGFAAELALKARYCSRKSLPLLPEDKKVLKSHKLNTHDLDGLLRLSDSAFISQSSMNEINWSCISDWDNEDRYKAVGSVSEQIATGRVEQTKLLTQELVEHEVVEAFVRARDQLLAEGVDLGLLAWAAADYGSMGWVTHLSSFWLDDPRTRTQRMQDLQSRIIAETPADLRGYVTTLKIYGRADEVPSAYYNLNMALSMGVGLVKHSAFIGAASPQYEFTGILRVKGVKSNAVSIAHSYVLRLSPPAL
jgi:hypothetical protein